MSTEIFYFSGTGNSLHVAKELHQRIPNSSLIPIVSFNEKKVVESSAETVGFVFPVHLMTIPGVVKDFIKRIDLKSANYVFAVATRCGTPCIDMIIKLEKILKKKGKNLDSYLILNMASNSPKFQDWQPPTTDVMAKFEAEIQERLNYFEEIVNSKRKLKEEDNHIILPVGPLAQRLGYILAEVSGDGKENFFADSSCTGCGICEQVCLSDKIKIVNNRPVWQKDKDCYSCYACINYCPNEAIQIKSSHLIKFYTDVNGRYYHPEITVDEIAGQKKYFENITN